MSSDVRSRVCHAVVGPITNHLMTLFSFERSHLRLLHFIEIDSAVFEEFVCVLRLEYIIFNAVWH